MHVSLQAKQAALKVCLLGDFSCEALKPLQDP